MILSCLNNWEMVPQDGRVDAENGKLLITDSLSDLPTGITFSRSREIRHFALNVDG
jgi:hypothetical protein